jgi:hypothetical protein
VTTEEICTAYRSFQLEKLTRVLRPGIICKELTNLGKMFSLERKAAKNISESIFSTVIKCFRQSEAKKYLSHPIHLA